MTPEELDAIAASWPEAARKGYQYYTTANVTEDGTDERYAALVGMGMMWLGTKPEFGSGLIKEDGRWHCLVVFDDTDVRYTEDHPLAAVHAAVTAVGKEGV